MKNLLKLLTRSATRRVVTALVVTALAGVGLAVDQDTVSLLLMVAATIGLGAASDEIEFDGDK